MNEDIVAIVSTFITVIVLGLGIPLVRAHVRRRELALLRPPVDSGTSERLDRIEQGVEAIAVEVERIAEGQRFVTRLLAERPMDRSALSGEQREG